MAARAHGLGSPDNTLWLYIVCICDTLTMFMSRCVLRQPGFCVNAAFEKYTHYAVIFYDYCYCKTERGQGHRRKRKRERERTADGHHHSTHTNMRAFVLYTRTKCIRTQFMRAPSSSCACTANELFPIRFPSRTRLYGRLCQRSARFSIVFRSFSVPTPTQSQRNYNIWLLAHTL